MIRNLEDLKKAAPNQFLADFVDTAWSWRSTSPPAARRPRSGLVNTITEEAPDPDPTSTTNPQSVYWGGILSRPKVLVDIGDQVNAAGTGGLARGPSGWLFKDFATNSEVANAIAAIPPPDPLALNDLTDVTLSSLLNGQRLTFNGVEWVNEPGEKHRWPINADGSYDFTIAYDPATKIVTVAPVGASFYCHTNGIKRTFTATHTFAAHGTDLSTYYYVDENGALTKSTTVWNLLIHVPICVVKWSTAKNSGYCVPEWHTDRMSARTHERLHEVQGAEAGRRSGFAISGYTYNLDTVAGVSFGVSGGLLWDEDIKHVIPTLADGSTYTVMYRTGATGEWTWDDGLTIPYKAGTTYASTNVFATGAWTQQDLDGAGSGQFANYFVVVAPNLNIAQLILVQGQGVFTSQALAEAQTWDSLDLGVLPWMEFAALYRVTIKSQVALSSTTKKTVIVSIAKVAGSGSGSSIGGSTTHNSLAGRSDADVHPFSSLAGILGSTQFPTLTGDVSNTALATTVTGLRGNSLPALGSAGNLRWSGSAWAFDSASYIPASGGSTNKVAKWTSATTLGYGIATDDGSTFSVAGNGSFTGAIDAGWSRMQTAAFDGAGTAWFGLPGGNSTTWANIYGMRCGAGVVRLHATSDITMVIGGVGIATFDAAGMTLPGCRFRDDIFSSVGYAIYPSGVTPSASNAAIYFSKNGATSGISGSASASLSIDGSPKASAVPAGFLVTSLSSGGMVRAASGTGLLSIAGRSDLPGGPYLPLTAGIGERVTGALYLDNDFFLDGRAFLGNGDFIVRTGEVIFKIGDGFGWASPSIHFPSVATQYSFRVEGGSRFDGTADFTNASAGIRTTDIKVGSVLQRAPHFYSTSDELPVLGVNEWCFLVCDDSSGSNLYWVTNSTQPVRVRSSGSTYTTSAGGNQVSDSAAIAINRTTCILIGPTDSGSNVCSLIPF